MLDSYANFFLYSFLNLRRFLGDEVGTDQFYIVKHVDVYKKRKKSYCCFLRAPNVDFFGQHINVKWTTVETDLLKYFDDKEIPILQLWGLQGRIFDEMAFETFVDWIFIRKMVVCEFIRRLFSKGYLSPVYKWKWN